MSRALIGRFLALSLWLLVGCAAPPPTSERVNESIILTKYAPGVDFGKYRTFFVRPEILTFENDAGFVPIDDRTAAPLLDATEKNLLARGYDEAANPEDADLAVTVMYTEQINSTYWCYYWWDPYYWGYPVWGYYPYYGACDTTVWKSGMLATVMVDLTVARENDPGLGEGGAGGSGPPHDVPGIWFSGIYGVSLSSSVARDGINQAFKQSPYISAD